MTKTRRFCATLALVAVVCAIAPIPTGAADAIPAKGTATSTGITGGVTWDLISYCQNCGYNYPPSHWVWDLVDITTGVGCGFASAGFGPMGAIFMASFCSWGIGE